MKYDKGYEDTPYNRVLYNKKYLATPYEEDTIHSIGPDPITKYKENVHGFRSTKPTKNTEMLYVGCSLTYGSGIEDEKDIWGNVLAKELDLKAASIARPGISTITLIRHLFEYFNTYGNPKYIFAMFPGFYRVPVPIDGEVNSSEVPVDNAIYGPWHYSKYHTTVHLEPNGKRPKLAKRPFLIEDVLSEDLSVDQTIAMLRVLEIYCKTNKINLIWSVWEKGYSETINTLPEDLEFDFFFNMYSSERYYKKYLQNTAKYVHFLSMDQPYCETRHRGIECSCYSNCHELEREKFGDREGFDAGLDTNEGPHITHPGVHSHLHFAEIFLKEFESRRESGKLFE